MLSKILGVVTIATGLLWLIKPETLRNRLKRKMGRKLRFIVYSFLIIFGLLITASVIKAPGLLSKLVGAIGMVVAIKGILMVTSKTSEKMLDWLGERPLQFFRMIAIFILVMGIMLVLA